MSAAATSVTVFLRAPNPTGLDRLAAARGLTHAQRVKRLARLVPSASTTNAVTQVLVADGLAVSDQTAWSVTATGSRPTIGALFGALPVVPALLAPYVSAVLPTRSGPAVMTDQAALSGGNLRGAYTSPGTKPPGAGAKSDGHSTIATLQLADYNSSDLTTYAAKSKLPKIVGTSKYHAVTVDGGPTKADNADGGDVEVDLDQESILATAPSATQRPYFAPNTNAGVNDALANVFDDVVQNGHDNAGGDPDITALSTSWGGCESGYGAAAIAATETMIKAVTAAGVTVFASAGDDGIYDCGATLLGLGSAKTDVEFPASSPLVVGVGGSNLAPTGKSAARNNGHNWHEAAWSCTNANSCASALSAVLPVLPGGTGGTGGGESGAAHTAVANSFAGFAEPAYQKSLTGVFARQPHRLVPDITADGDPSTGFDIYTSDSGAASSENAKGMVQVGGTSLASPVSAALFTNALAAGGHHTGIGDIHTVLYRTARQHPKAFRDVTAGTNGAAANRGNDPSVSARRGYDTVSGLGGVLWPALTKYLLPKHKAKHHKAKKRHKKK